MHDWKPYINNRKYIIDAENQFYVIVPADFVKPAIPVSCGLCKILLRSKEDEESYTKYECCDHCANNLIKPNLEKWLSGEWKPENINYELQLSTITLTV